jgi:hypothetical protein
LPGPLGLFAEIVVAQSCAAPDIENVHAVPISTLVGNAPGIEFNAAYRSRRWQLQTFHVGIRSTICSVASL